MKRNLIWGEVSCRKCVTVANFSGWYSPERIKKLKLETKSWGEDDDYGVLCPDCYEDVKREKELGIK
mgnify:CR=1 FL=1